MGTSWKDTKRFHCQNKTQAFGAGGAANTHHLPRMSTWLHEPCSHRDCPREGENRELRSHPWLLSRWRRLFILKGRVSRDSWDEKPVFRQVATGAVRTVTV